MKRSEVQRAGSAADWHFVCVSIDKKDNSFWVKCQVAAAAFS